MSRDNNSLIYGGQAVGPTGDIRAEFLSDLINDMRNNGNNRTISTTSAYEVLPPSNVYSGVTTAGSTIITNPISQTSGFDYSYLSGNQFQTSSGSAGYSYQDRTVSGINAGQVSSVIQFQEDGQRMVDGRGNVKKNFFMDILADYNLHHPNSQFGEKLSSPSMPISEYELKYKDEIERYLRDSQKIQQIVEHNSRIEREIVHAEKPTNPNNGRPTNLDGRPAALINPRWAFPIPPDMYDVNAFDPANVEVQRKVLPVDFDPEPCKCELKVLRPPTPEPDELRIGYQNVSLPEGPPDHYVVPAPRAPTPATIVIAQAPPPVRSSIKIRKVIRRYVRPPPRRIIVEFLPQIPRQANKEIYVWKQPNRRLKITEEGPPPTFVPQRRKNLHIHWVYEGKQGPCEKKFLGEFVVDPNVYVRQYKDLLTAEQLINHPIYKECVTPEAMRQHNVDFEGKYVIEGNANWLFYIGEAEILQLISLGYSRESLLQYSSRFTQNFVYSHKFSEFELRNLFDHIDSNRDGYIERGEMQIVIDRINRGKNKNKYGTLDIDQFFIKVDFDKNKRIDFNEFNAAFQKYLAEMRGLNVF